MYLPLTIQVQARIWYLNLKTHTNAYVCSLPIFLYSQKEKVTENIMNVLHISERQLRTRKGCLPFSFHYYDVQSISSWLLNCFKTTKHSIYWLNFFLPQLALKRTTIEPLVQVLGFQTTELISIKKIKLYVQWLTFT